LYGARHTAIAAPNIKEKTIWRKALKQFNDTPIAVIEPKGGVLKFKVSFVSALRVRNGGSEFRIPNPVFGSMYSGGDFSDFHIPFQRYASSGFPGFDAHSYERSQN
jgi:hypothetical protein